MHRWYQVPCHLPLLSVTAVAAGCGEGRGTDTASQMLGKREEKGLSASVASRMALYRFDYYYYYY